MSYAQSVEITNRYSQARNYSAVEERNLSNSCVGGGGRGGGGAEGSRIFSLIRAVHLFSTVNNLTNRGPAFHVCCLGGSIFMADPRIFFNYIDCHDYLLGWYQIHKTAEKVNPSIVCSFSEMFTEISIIIINRCNNHCITFSISFFSRKMSLSSRRGIK